MKVICFVLVLFALAAGTAPAAGPPAFTGTYDKAVKWSDRKDTRNGAYVTYQVSHVHVTGNRWTITATITNHTRDRLFQMIWNEVIPADQSFNGLPQQAWWGPALAYPAINALGQRQLVRAHASTQTPAFPRPLRPGKTWSGTISGTADLPARTPIYVQFNWVSPNRPWVGIDWVYKGWTTNPPAGAFYWISNAAFTLS